MKTMMPAGSGAPTIIRVSSPMTSMAGGLLRPGTNVVRVRAPGTAAGIQKLREFFEYYIGDLYTGHLNNRTAQKLDNFVSVFNVMIFRCPGTLNLNGTRKFHKARPFNVKYIIFYFI